MRIIILSALAVLLMTTALVGINMYHNPSLTIASMKGATVQPNPAAESEDNKTQVDKNQSVIAKPKSTRNLKIAIKGTRNQRGQIIVQIYDDANAFNTLQYDKALHTRFVP